MVSGQRGEANALLPISAIAYFRTAWKANSRTSQFKFANSCSYHRGLPMKRGKRHCKFTRKSVMIWNTGSRISLITHAVDIRVGVAHFSREIQPFEDYSMIPSFCCIIRTHARYKAPGTLKILLPILSAFNLHSTPLMSILHYSWLISWGSSLTNALVTCHAQRAGGH